MVKISELLVKERDIVVPGEEIAHGLDFVPSYGTYRNENKIISSRLGLVAIQGQVVKVIPLSGRYTPKSDDVIIGRVIDVGFSGWRLDLNSAYTAMLNVKDATSDFITKGADLTRFFDIGDYVVAKITNVTSQKLVDLTIKAPGLKKLKGGRIILVDSTKVPRIIGKMGSMVKMIKEATGCNILVGQNGVVWVEGPPEKEIEAIDTIRKIEKESHVSGLTDTIKQYLDDKVKK